MTSYAWIALTSAWVMIIIQGILLLFLYRLVGQELLKRSQAVARDGIALGSIISEIGAIPRLVSRGLVREEPVRFDRTQFFIFGSTACDPCKKLLPELAGFARDHPTMRSILVMKGAADAAFEPLADAFADHRLSMPEPFEVRLDAESAMFARFKIRVTPFGVITDERGVVRAKGLVNGRAHLNLLLRQAEEWQTR